MKGFELVKREDHWGLYNEDGHKIASTLDGCNSKLSIKNCEAIANGYDLDELAEEKYHGHVMAIDWQLEKRGFIAGFQKALEILGDKKFSEDDMKNGIEYGIQSVLQAVPGVTSTQSVLDNYIQSLQQTEFDVEILMEYKQQLANGYKNQYENVLVTKLDSEGNLILKRL